MSLLQAASYSVQSVRYRTLLMVRKLLVFDSFGSIYLQVDPK